MPQHEECILDAMSKGVEKKIFRITFLEQIEKRKILDIVKGYSTPYDVTFSPFGENQVLITLVKC